MEGKKKVLIIGAGRSSSALIAYLCEQAEHADWHITVADRDLSLAQERCADMPQAEAVSFDALDAGSRKTNLPGHDVVVSMLPARFHIEVVKDCLELGIPVITPSYITPEIKALDEEAKKKGILILNEMGLDPGIDHMSAMRIIDRIQAQGAELTSFKSFTGGLIAPESDDNPWNYKFTWNPRNVVLAGQGGAVQFIRNGRYKYIPYHRLFSRTESIHIEGHGEFEGYANRDSLKYRSIYGLEDIPTIYRGTLRRKGFSAAWDVFVQLGMTDDTYTLEDSEQMTYRDFINTYLSYEVVTPVEQKLCDYLHLDRHGEIMKKLEWLGIFEQRQIGLKKASPAQILQQLLEEKWKLRPEDKDMIAMYHYFEYVLNGEKKAIHSHMISIGKDQTFTGMSRTVGLPIGIAVKLMLEDRLELKGVHLPIMPELYDPILDELETMDIVFHEYEG
ncbi:MAG: saccharopine dehydrogenase [Flavobacteriales bacterium]|nr:saccharopine dehydrogenase [Flavobacteriales bacterium]